jgi:hypothetical protein
MRPITTLDCVPLEDKILVFTAGLGPEILDPVSEYYQGLTTLPNAVNPPSVLSFFLYSAQRLPRTAQVQQLSFEASLASLSAIWFPRTPACPAIQYSPALCRVDK